MIKGQKIQSRPRLKTFHIFTEGKNTEPSYFALLQTLCKKVNICVDRGNTKTQPYQVLERAQNFIDKHSAYEKGKDDVWVVVDIDGKPKSSFKKLHEWEDTNNKYWRVALSCPKFEFWLFLHYEPHKSHLSAKQCEAKLKKHLPANYKHGSSLPAAFCNLEKVEAAITRAKKLRVENLFQDNHSSVYKLVEKILMASQPSHH